MSNRERGARLAVRYYRKKDRRKLRAFNHSFQLPEYFREMIGDKRSILVADLGAGSIPTTGDTWPGVEVTILASDILADEYNQIWKDTNRVILNPVTKQDMEALTYPDNYFDIVHCVNALDHSEDPPKAIMEMLRVCKPGGWVYLRHVPNEGVHQSYQGFHQWNFDVIDGEGVLWNEKQRFLLSVFGFTTCLKTEISNSIYESEESVVSRLRKPERSDCWLGTVLEGHLEGEHRKVKEWASGRDYTPPAHFGKYARFGDYHWREYERGTKYRRHADRVAAWIKEAHTLDIGAGDGKITSMLRGAVVGIDNEPEGVRLAREHDVNVILGDAYEIPYPDDHFDSVLMADVLEHFEFPVKALLEARRVMTKYLYITTPPKRPDGKLTDKYHWVEWTPEELKTLVESTGFVLDGEIDVVLADKVMYARFKKV